MGAAPARRSPYRSRCRCRPGTRAAAACRSPVSTSSARSRSPCCSSAPACSSPGRGERHRADLGGSRPQLSSGHHPACGSQRDPGTHAEHGIGRGPNTPPALGEVDDLRPRTRRRSSGRRRFRSPVGAGTSGTCPPWLTPPPTTPTIRQPARFTVIVPQRVAPSVPRLDPAVGEIPRDCADRAAGEHEQHGHGRSGSSGSTSSCSGPMRRRRLQPPHHDHAGQRSQHTSRDGRGDAPPPGLDPAFPGRWSRRGEAAEQSRAGSNGRTSWCGRQTSVTATISAPAGTSRARS